MDYTNHSGGFEPRDDLTGEALTSVPRHRVRGRDTQHPGTGAGVSLPPDLGSGCTRSPYRCELRGPLRHGKPSTHVSRGMRRELKNPVG